MAPALCRRLLDPAWHLNFILISLFSFFLAACQCFSLAALLLLLLLLVPGSRWGSAGVKAAIGAAAAGENSLSVWLLLPFIAVLGAPAHGSLCSSTRCQARDKRSIDVPVPGGFCAAGTGLGCPGMAQPPCPARALRGRTEGEKCVGTRALSLTPRCYLLALPPDLVQAFLFQTGFVLLLESWNTLAWKGTTQTIKDNSKRASESCPDSS